jgi:hypothetical protein
LGVQLRYPDFTVGLAACVARLRKTASEN